MNCCICEPKTYKLIHVLEFSTEKNKWWILSFGKYSLIGKEYLYKLIYINIIGIYMFL